MTELRICPDRRHLSQLLLGQTSDEESVILSEHLAQCPSCQAETQTLAVNDTFVSLIRQAGQQPEDETPAELARVIAALQDPTKTAAHSIPRGDTMLSDIDDSRVGSKLKSTAFDDELTDILTRVRPAEAPNELGRLSDFRLIKLLGHGGMGAVFLAEDVRLQRPVALKLVRPDIARKSEGKERFLREARAMAHIKHDNVVMIHQVGEENGVPFLAQEFLEGETLEARLSCQGRFSIAEAIGISQQIAAGLAAAHARGLVHRDIKPANVFLVENLHTPGTAERVKLLDFGLARIVSDNTQLTQSGLIIGTPAYMSPEQASGEAIDHRSDLFSLGCVLYVMLTGERPFRGENMMKSLASLANDMPIAVHVVRLEVPAELSRLIDQLLAKSAGDRPGTANEVAARLAAIMNSPKPPTGAPQPASAHDPPQRPLNKSLTILSGAAASILMFVIIIAITNKDGSKSEIVVDGTSKIEILNGSVETSIPQADTSQGSATTPIASPGMHPNLNDPAFLEWMMDVATMPAEMQVEAVSKKLQILNPTFDGRLSGGGAPGTQMIENGAVTRIGFASDNVTDLSPVRALKQLKILECPGSGRAMNGLSDLSPLQGLSLTHINIAKTSVSDLRPLQGMPLFFINFRNTTVGDLQPLKGMPLRELYCNGTLLSDFSTLAGMDLITLCFTPKNITHGMLGVRLMRNLRSIRLTEDESEQFLPDDFWEKYDAGEFELKSMIQAPAFLLWTNDVAAMSADRQVIAVINKLQDLNPCFDGKVTGGEGQGLPQIENGAVTGFGFVSDNVTDLSPVRALKQLQNLYCAGSGRHDNALSDLTPLEGMRLATLNLGYTRVVDLSPLKAMPLKRLSFQATQVSDLSALQEMPLETIQFNNSWVVDLSPLKGMPLKAINCGVTKVADLSPLRGMSLESFDGNLAPMIHSLLPLRGMPLKQLHIVDTHVFDLSPLQGMPLTSLSFTPRNITKGLDIIRQMKRLQTVGLPEGESKPPDEFWKKYDAGEFPRSTAFNDPEFQQWIQDVAAMPAEQQVEAFAKKLVELNPGFDGKVAPTIQEGVVRGVQVTSEAVSDISPVRAFPGLTSLQCEYTNVADLMPLRGMRLANLRFGVTQVSDLSPLKGIPLTHLSFFVTPVSDLSPLKGMKLVSLECFNTQVADLSPLKGMPLVVLHCHNTPNITDLSPVKGMPLQNLICDFKAERDTELLRSIKTLESIDGKPADDFWKVVDENQTSKKPLGFQTPGFERWVNEVAALPAEKQVRAVVKKLQELNPGFDGKWTGRDGELMPEIENGEVTEFGFVSDNVTDLSPVRALQKLKILVCMGTSSGQRGLSDLSPLNGMPLTRLNCSFSHVIELSPLQGMSLIHLNCGVTPIADLTPLKGMPLTGLWCSQTQVSDLSPLIGMPLTSVECYGTQVLDLLPLSEMSLDYLHCGATQVSDLLPLKEMKTLRNLNFGNTPVSDPSPLIGMSLTELSCYEAQVTDLSFLQGMKLMSIFLTPKNVTKGMEIVRQMKSLQTIRTGFGQTEQFLPDEFWKKYDAGEFRIPAPQPDAK